MTDALVILQEYAPQAVAAVGGAAGVLKGGAWVVERVVKARTEKREADAAWREEMRAGLRATASALSGLEKQVAVMASQITAHDQRTQATATLVQETREDLSALRGEILHRVAHAENDAGTALHVATEANALATNAHQRLGQRPAHTLDTINGGPFGRPPSRG